MTGSASLLCALLLVACRSEPSLCPEAAVTADPQEIPEGVNETDLVVEVTNPDPDNELEVITELTSISGTITDPFAGKTTFACAHDVSGPVEICANATYIDENGVLDGAEDPNVGASQQYIRRPHVLLYSPLECSETQCIVVTCPDEKNVCPVVSSLTVEPRVVPEGGTTVIEVVAEDPDDNPEALVTTITARHGTVADPEASTPTYACDPDIGGAIEICVVASDGDSSCDAQLCTWVRCPGEPLENTCPIIEDLRANPNPIPTGDETTTIFVDAIDPDDYPDPLETTLTSGTGSFQDPNASTTVFHCEEAGPVKICVEASDGDPACDVAPEDLRCITVECPSDVRANVCPNLNNINALQSSIPSGENPQYPEDCPGQRCTRIETNGWDTDRKPFPLVLTLNALWGSFANTENLMCEANDPTCTQSSNVVFQRANYICDRPGFVELCVDATDGLCTKTLCTDVECPTDVP
jgi:hypothetical protein